MTRAGQDPCRRLKSDKYRMEMESKNEALKSSLKMRLVITLLDAFKSQFCRIQEMPPWGWIKCSQPGFAEDIQTHESNVPFQPFVICLQLMESILFRVAIVVDKIIAGN